jgi:hypothetical protein
VTVPEFILRDPARVQAMQWNGEEAFGPYRVHRSPDTLKDQGAILDGVARRAFAGGLAVVYDVVDDKKPRACCRE